MKSIQATLRLDGQRGFVRAPAPAPAPAPVVPVAQGKAIFCKLAKKEWPGRVVDRIGNMVTVELFNKSR